MKFKIEATGDIYNLLANLNSHDSDNEEWKTGMNQSTKNLLPLSRVYGLVELPYPLNFAGLIVKKSGNFYSANIDIYARHQDFFKNTSYMIEETFDHLNPKFWNIETKFLETTSDGTGYVVGKKSNTPLFSISDLANKIASRSIGMGMLGAAPQKFTTIENFRKDISELENVTNHYVDICLTPFSNKFPSNIFKDITFYFNP